MPDIDSNPNFLNINLYVIFLLVNVVKKCNNILNIY